MSQVHFSLVIGYMHTWLHTQSGTPEPPPIKLNCETVVAAESTNSETGELNALKALKRGLLTFLLDLL